jgi:hypothetical protein
MEEVGESRVGRLGEGVILTRRGTVRRLCPHPLLHYCKYVPLDCTSGSVSGAKPPIYFLYAIDCKYVTLKKFQ